MSDESNLGQLVIDPFATEATAEQVLLEIAEVLKKRGYLLQMGFSPHSRKHLIILARVTGPAEALGIAEVQSLNPLYVEYRLLAGGKLMRKAEVVQ